MTINVVLGAGGPTGLQCVKRLIDETESVVRAVVRDPAKHQDKFPASDRLQVVKGDVTEKASLPDALKDATGVIFAASGSTYRSPAEVDNNGVLNVAEVAKELGVPHVVLISSALVSPHNGWNPIRMMLNNLRYKLMDNKFKGEEHLRQSGVPYTVVRPGRLSDGPAEKDRIISGQGDKPLTDGAISRADVARVCVEALRNPAAKNVTMEVYSKGLLGEVSPSDNIRSVFADVKPNVL